MKKFLLVISKNYWGTTQSERTATLFKDTICSKINITHVTRLIGNKVNVYSVKKTISDYVTQSLSELLKEEVISEQPVFFIYINGHGNQIKDSDNDESDYFDELYDLPDSHIKDDNITEIINNAIIKHNNDNTIIKPIIFLISDHCSSGSMIDKHSDSNKLVYDWITLGSSSDFQDSYITGNGHVMSMNFLDVLNSFTDEFLNRVTVLEFFKILDAEIKGSFIGELQSLTLRVSNKNLFFLTPFSKKN